MNFPRVFRLHKKLVRRVNRKSVKLKDGQALRVKRIVDDHAWLLILR
jgi:hypothetical protein